jgi:hypothetical protein
MPEENYSFVPADGEFTGVRNLGQIVKACSRIQLRGWRRLAGRKSYQSAPGCMRMALETYSMRFEVEFTAL